MPRLLPDSSLQKAKKSRKKNLCSLLHVPVIDHWWQTETGWPICADCVGLEPLPVKPGSAAKPVPGWRVDELNETGKAVEDERNRQPRLQAASSVSNLGVPFRDSLHLFRREVTDSSTIMALWLPK
jgi:hypothetical protein